MTNKEFKQIKKPPIFGFISILWALVGQTPTSLACACIGFYYDTDKVLCTIGLILSMLITFWQIIALIMLLGL